MSFSAPRSALALATALALLAGGAATSLAAVTVYSNDFGSRPSSTRSCAPAAASAATATTARSRKVMLASVKKSPTTCSFRPPVQGDDELPNHGFAVEGKILKKTPKSMRDGAFIEVDRPRRRRRHRLHAADLPRSAALRARRGAGRRRLPGQGQERRDQADQRAQPARAGRHRRRDHRVRQRQGGREVNDTNPGQVPGRKLRFALGSQPDKEKTVVATFKRVAVAVPDPLAELPESRDLNRDDRAPADRRPGLRPRRQLAGDRPQRRSQHLRPRRPARSPA